MLPEMERVVVEVFGGCDYSCTMCPQSVGRGAAFTRKMPFNLFENILDQLSGNPVINLEGSGEPTLAPDLPRYIQACTDRGFRSFIFTNGRKFTGQYMKDCIDAGLSFVRFSVIGYTPDLYTEWMTGDNFQTIINNMKETRNYIESADSECVMSSYHLILDNDNVDYEVEQYKKNIVNETGSVAYIWKQHNWSGNIDASYVRQGEKRTCGRPFSNILTIRAGGNGGQRGAVTPCCQTMGEPNEEKSVLGHASNMSLEDIWFGEKYNELRKGHEMKEWPDYCKNCDFLISDPEVLVWSNDPEATNGKILGTNVLLHGDAS